MRILKNDLTGKRFGKVFVVKRVKNKNNRVAYLCRCDCGTEFVTLSQHLVCGATKSCGCLNRENASKRLKTRNKKHGFSKTRLYFIWKNMRSRCNSTYNTAFENYGGRGIMVCDEWNEYENFHKWAMSSGYSNDLTIDRIDVDGNYEPNNCRWVSASVQANNKRTNRIISHDGETKTMSQWAKESGITYQKLKYRINKKMADEDVFSKEMFSRKAVVCVETGEKYISMNSAGRMTGIHPSAISACCRGVRKTAGGFTWKYYQSS